MVARGTIPQIPPIESTPTRRIAFVGLDKAGKTTTLKRLSKGILMSTRPTHGFNTEAFNFLGLRFNVFDLGGQDSYQIFWEKFLPQQEAVVFFIDSADTKRLAKVRFALNKTLSLVKPEISVMILANKQDLPNALNVSDLIKNLDLRFAPKLQNLEIFPVSALTGLGLYDAFQWLASVLEINVGESKCTLYGFYVYEKNVGIPLIASESVMKIKNPLLSSDPTMITALHSALRSFATEMVQTELKTVKVKSSKTGQRFQLVTIGYENLIVVLVTPEGDNEDIISALGEAILKIVLDKLDLTEVMPELKDFHLNEVLKIIKPFLRNVEELKESAAFRGLDTDFPLSSQQQIRSEPITTSSSAMETSDNASNKLTFSDIDSSSSNELSTQQNSFSHSSTSSSSSSSAQDSSSQPSKPITPSSSGPSPVSNQQNQTTPPKAGDDMMFFRMGVAERIKYLQETRKRLQD
ncbi:MAG: ADP-ribosylation factor family protein [Promethearchaeota archaeon]